MAKNIRRSGVDTISSQDIGEKSTAVHPTMAGSKHPRYEEGTTATSTCITEEEITKFLQTTHEDRKHYVAALTLGFLIGRVYWPTRIKNVEICVNQAAFDKLKQAISETAMAGPDPKLQYHLVTGASHTALGGCLFQLHGTPAGTEAEPEFLRNERSIIFLLYRLQDAGTRYLN